MIEHGRKIARDIENPIDNIFIDVASYVSPYFRKLNFTPNGITTLSILAGTASAYCLYIDNLKGAALLYVVAYFLDCLDGFYARKYKMETEFGDFYDHLGDILKHIMLAYVIYARGGKKKLLKIIIIFGLPLLMLFVHIGCQERHNIYNNNKCLELFKFLCKDKSHIHYTKIFGCGTPMLITTIIILMFDRI